MCSALLKRVEKTILQIFEYTHHTLPEKKCIRFLGTLDTTILAHKLSTKTSYIYILLPDISIKQNKLCPHYDLNCLHRQTLMSFLLILTDNNLRFN